MSAERELLERLVKTYDQWVRGRESAFQEIPSYNGPVEGDQPCTDEDMGDYDELDEECAYEAQESWAEFAEAARKLLKGEQ